MESSSLKWAWERAEKEVDELEKLEAEITSAHRDLARVHQPHAGNLFVDRVARVKSARVAAERRKAQAERQIHDALAGALRHPDPRSATIDVSIKVALQHLDALEKTSSLPAA